MAVSPSRSGISETQTVGYQQHNNYNLLMKLIRFSHKKSGTTSGLFVKTLNSNGQLDEFMFQGSRSISNVIDIQTLSDLFLLVCSVLVICPVIGQIPAICPLIGQIAHRGQI